MTERPIPKMARSGLLQNRRFLVGAAILLALVVAVVLWLVRRDSGDSSAAAPQNATKASVDQIRTLAKSVGHPVFWVGPKEGYTYELTQASNGSIYVRYLPPGEKVGVKTPYLTVATYPFPGAYAAIKKVAKQKGVTRLALAHGGLAEVSRDSPQSVHAAYPGVDYQVEVFDPTDGTAAGLVTTGQLAALGKLKASVRPEQTAARPSAVSAAELRSLAASLGHAVYWVGAKKGYVYEATQTPSGQVYVRYLPPGVAVGANSPQLTVATYPFAGAFSAILALAKQKGAVTIKLDNGGRAVVDPSRPSSIHLAYPASNYEIEVFDPSAARVRRIVSSGQVQSIG
jgi:hypothetical protein